MKCAPNYNQKERGEVEGVNNADCFHWEACKKELGLPQDYKFPIWKEEKPTIKDYLAGRYHLNKISTKKPQRIWR